MSPDIPFPGYIEQKRQLTQWKKRCDPAPPAGAKERAPRESESNLKEVHSQVTQDVVKRLHNSWESFRQRGRGFPRFKKFGRSLTKFGGNVRYERLGKHGAYKLRGRPTKTAPPQATRTPETDTATPVPPLGETTAVAPLGETPRPHCLPRPDWLNFAQSNLVGES